MEEIALGILRVGNASAPKAEKPKATWGESTLFLGVPREMEYRVCLEEEQKASSYGVANRDHVSGEEGDVGGGVG